MNFYLLIFLFQKVDLLMNFVSPQGMLGQELGGLLPPLAFGSFYLQFPTGVESELTEVCNWATEGVKEEAVTEL